MGSHVGAVGPQRLGEISHAATDHLDPSDSPGYPVDWQEMGQGGSRSLGPDLKSWLAVSLFTSSSWTNFQTWIKKKTNRNRHTHQQRQGQHWPRLLARTGEATERRKES